MLEGHGDWVKRAIVTDDDKYIVTGSKDKL